MSVHIVVTEAYYGSPDFVRVFQDRQKADQYASQLDLETLILARSVPSLTDTLYVVVTEEWFGGEEQVRVFTNHNEATDYCGSLQVDSVILTKSVI